MFFADFENVRWGISVWMFLIGILKTETVFIDGIFCVSCKAILYRKSSLSLIFCCLKLMIKGF